jgi:hypothetical protein
VARIVETEGEAKSCVGVLAHPKQLPTYLQPILTAYSFY